MIKDKKYTNSRPDPMQQHHSYGVRYWNGIRWMYRGMRYRKGFGLRPCWTANEAKAYTTTDLLSALFQAQGLANEIDAGSIDVVEFVYPKVVWSTCKDNRKLLLEEAPAKQALTLGIIYFAHTWQKYMAGMEGRRLTYQELTADV